MVSRNMLDEHYLSNISVGSHISKTHTITTIIMIMSTRRRDRWKVKMVLATCEE